MNSNHFNMNSFSDHLFWDTDESQLDLDRSKSFIIHRVLEYGLMDDWNMIKHIYGLSTIKEEVVRFRELDDVTLAFLCTLFDLKKQDFRCYTLRQSVKNYWSY